MRTTSPSFLIQLLWCQVDSLTVLLRYIRFVKANLQLSNDGIGTRIASAPFYYSPNCRRNFTTPSSPRIPRPLSLTYPLISRSILPKMLGCTLCRLPLRPSEEQGSLAAIPSQCQTVSYCDMQRIPIKLLVESSLGKNGDRPIRDGWRRDTVTRG